MGVIKDGGALVDPHKGLVDLAHSLTDGFHLGAGQDHPRLKGFIDKEIPASARVAHLLEAFLVFFAAQASSFSGSKSS